MTIDINTTKSFTRFINGKDVTYKRTAKGYCFCDGKRISAQEFDQANAAMFAERAEAAKTRAEQIKRVKAAVERSEEPSREEYENRREQMNIIEIDGVEWANDHINRKVYRDGVECSRKEFNRAMGIRRDSAKEDRPARKPRKSKDVVFEHEGITLTAKQADFLRELSAAGDATLGNCRTGWWTDCLCDAIGGQFQDKPMAVGAMISTLCEKGLGERSKEQRDQGNGRTRKVTGFNLTENGREVWEAMGLK